MVLSRLTRFALLFVLLLPVVGFVFLQTDYAKNHLAHWIERKTEGVLTIGQIKGILPFWAHLQDVHYHTPTLDVTFDDVKVALLPTTLIYGRIAIADMEIHRATIHSPNDKIGDGMPAFPTLAFPWPIDIYRFSIQRLSYNSIEDLHIHGLAEITDHFWLRTFISHPKLPEELLFTASSEPEKGTLHIMAQLKQMYVKGDYHWNRRMFTGNWHGQQAGIKLNGACEIDFKTHHLMTTGDVLDRPFVLHANLQDLRDEPIQFTYGDHQWKATGSYHLDTHLLSFHLHGHEIFYKQAYVPELVMNGTYQNRTLHFSLSLSEFAILDPAYEMFPKVTLSLEGNATCEKVAVAGTILGFSEQPFTLALELPLLLQFSPFIADIDRHAPFSMRICGQGSIDPLLAFFENASLIAHGIIDLDLQATGSLETPQLSGHLIYDQGRIESFTTGALFQDIRMEMEGVGQTLQICSLTAHDMDQGDLTGSGFMTWDPAQNFPFSFDLFASRYLILGVDPFTATVNARVIISGSTQGITITGEADLLEGHLAIPSDLPLQVPTVEVCYVNAPTPPLAEKALHPKLPIHWDLILNAGRHLLIDGRGLHSEWSGALHITGEQNAFQFNGKLHLVQGRFKILNQTFTLVHGRICIEGLTPEEIIVDLKGDYELPNLTASLVVTGRLDRTQIGFCSNPPMNTNQILSWILFQQDINELTPLQACRLASILVSLSGKYSGPKTFDKIKDKLGIDVFSITDCNIDTADLTFQVGKYLSQGTFVGINKSISGDSDSVLIQTRLFRNFYLEADYGGSLNSLTPTGGKAIFKWYKSY
jgi:autotransporter translocation and assembly factor TamB